MNVKKYRIALIVSAFLVTIVCVIIVVYTKSTENNYYKSTEQVSEYRYILKEYNQQIGVFKANSQVPLKLLDVYTFNLPIIDQYELKEGIYVLDDEKLRIIIEDYSS